MVTRQTSHDDFAVEPRSVDLRDYWQAVRRRWLSVALLTILGLAGGLSYAFHSKPHYAATAQVVVTPLAEGPLNLPSASSKLINMSTEQTLASSAPVAREAAKLLGISPATLQAEVAGHLKVVVPNLSDVLQITWQGDSPVKAQAGANAFARGYLAYRHSQMEGQIAGLTSALGKQAHSLNRSITSISAQLSAATPQTAAYRNLGIKLNQLTAQLKVVNSQLATLSAYNVSGGNLIAAARGTASGLSRSLMASASGLIGLIVGLTFALARDTADDRLHDATQLESKLRAATLAVLPNLSSQAAAAATPGELADGARALRAMLVAAGIRRDQRTILFLSADDSPLASYLAAGLGVTLAESAQRALVIASDLRGSRIPEIFNLPSSAGLSDLAAGSKDVESAIRRPRQAGGKPLSDTILRNLRVLPPGGMPMAETLSILDGGVMLSLLSTLRESFDFALLDAPPTVVAIDYLALATQVDGVIVVASKGNTRGRAIAALREQLDQVGAHIIGGVFVAKGSLSKHGDRNLLERGSPDTGALHHDVVRQQELKLTRPLQAIQDPAGPRAPEDRSPERDANRSLPRKLS